MKAAELTAQKTRLLRPLPRWMARPISSLPVPVSPVTSTVLSVAETRCTIFSRSRMFFERPRISP